MESATTKVMKMLRNKKVPLNKTDVAVIDPDIKPSVKEEKESTAVFGFGRTNPPTTGHQKLLNKIGEVADAHGGSGHFVASHSEGTAKNPIPQDKKIGYLKKIAPKNVAVSGSSKEAPTFIQAAKKLHDAGHQHLVMVAGSDRVDEYKNKLNQYNGKEGHYNFKSIKVVSAGQRDPDAEGTAGISGTKMRAHAHAGNTAAFKAGLPKELHPHAKEIMDHIRAIKEEVEPVLEAKRMSPVAKLIKALDSQRKKREFSNDWARKHLQSPTQQDVQKKVIDEETLDEMVLNQQQRRKRAVSIRRHKAKMARARELAVKRSARGTNITKRSQKLARRAIRKRVAGKMGANYQMLPVSSKMAVDRLTQKKVATIRKLAKRLVPYVKQAESKRLIAGKRAPTYSTRPISASTEYDLDKIMLVAEQAYNFYEKQMSVPKKKKSPSLPQSDGDMTDQGNRNLYESYAPTAQQLGIRMQGGFSHHPSVQQMLDSQIELEDKEED